MYWAHSGDSFCLVYSTLPPHHIYHVGCRNESCVFLSIFACLLCCLQDMCLIFRDPWHICYLGGSGSIKVMAHGISNQSALIGNKFRLSTKKISKPHTTLPWWEKPPVIGGFPSQRASNTDNIPMPWHLHGGGGGIHVLYVILGAISLQRCHFNSIGIPMLKIRQYHNSYL